MGGNNMDFINASTILFGFIGLICGIAIMVAASKAGLNRDKQAAKLLLEDADNKAKNIVKQAQLDGKTQVYDLKLQAEKEIKERRNELQDYESKLMRREDQLNFRDETLSCC